MHIILKLTEEDTSGRTSTIKEMEEKNEETQDPVSSDDTQSTTKSKRMLIIYEYIFTKANDDCFL